MVPSLANFRFVADGCLQDYERSDRIVIGWHRLVAFERRYFVAGGRSQHLLGALPKFKCKVTKNI